MKVRKDDAVLMRVLLTRAAERRQSAVEDYRTAIRLAREAGWTNSEIARTVGVSEAAIRAFWRRSTAEKPELMRTG